MNIYLRSFNGSHRLAFPQDEERVNIHDLVFHLQINPNRIMMNRNVILHEYTPYILGKS